MKTTQKELNKNILEKYQGFVEAYKRGFLSGYMKSKKTTGKDWKIWKKIEKQCHDCFMIDMGEKNGRE